MSEATATEERGPVYGVTLIDALPMGDTMRQQMPDREDLIQVQRLNERVVAGYEVLLSHYQRVVAAERASQETLRLATFSMARCVGVIDQLRDAATAAKHAINSLLACDGITHVLLEDVRTALDEAIERADHVTKAASEGRPTDL